MLRAAFLLIIFIFVSVPASAQETRTPAFIQQENYEQRLELARRVHDYKPVDQQIEGALNILAADLPLEERQLFRRDVMTNIDLQRLRSRSIETMANIFNLNELQVILEYYQNPESQTIEAKSPIYRRRMDPEIITAINQSLTRIEAALAAGEAATIAPAAGQ